MCRNGPKGAHRRPKEQENFSEILSFRTLSIVLVLKNKLRETKGREFLAGKQVTVLEHPPYSSVLAPNDFLLFQKIKEILKEGIFVTFMISGVIRRQF
jgi:hypothetical protein